MARVDFYEFATCKLFLVVSFYFVENFTRCSLEGAEPAQSSVRGILKNSFDWPLFFFWARIALFAMREQRFTVNAVSVRILSSWALEINAQDPHRCGRKGRPRFCRAMELLSRWFPKKDPLAISAGN